MLRPSASLFALAAFATLTAPTARSQSSEQYLERAKAVLRSVPLIDGHNDLPWRIREDKSTPRDVEAYDLRKRAPGMTDLARLKEGMLGAQFWSVYIPGEIRDSGYARVQLEQIDIARRVVAKYPDVLVWTLTADDIERAHKEGKIGSLLGMEGGHAIENSVGALRAYYGMGVRYMTLTHNVTFDWADAALDSAKHGGLTPFGKEVVREMNRLGMLVDLSHVSPGTMSSALDVTESPVIFSHSGSRELVDHRRNVPDSILARMPKNGGVVMVPFVTSFVSKKVYEHDLDEARVDADLERRFPKDSASRGKEKRAWSAQHPKPPATVSDVADHIDHVRKIAGVDHVGIGSDFDGITETIVGLEDVSKFPFLFAELAKRGWSDDDLRKLAGTNVLRVLRQSQVVAARLQKERPSSTKTIQEMDGPVTRP